jgi:choline dehydrogenase-like flavoprotein
MFIDARSIVPGTVIEAELCVVGAGAAGITLAQEFVGSSINVCVIESGDIEFNWQTQALYEGANVGLRYFDLDICQIRYFGGNTNAWGGWCRPLDPIDFEHRPWVEHSGWPFPAAELRPYYRHAHALCEIPSDDYDPRAAAVAIGHPRAQLLSFDPAKVETSIYRFSSPTRFGRVYRETLRKAENVRCYLNANVLALRTTDDARTVTHLAVGCLSGTRFNVAAKHYVLAAGGIENTRLLLLSNDVVANGLGNQHDLVGRYFMEHPHTKRRLIATRRSMPSALYGLAFRDRAISARLALPAALQQQEGLLNYSGNIHPEYFCHNAAGWLAFRKLVLSVDPGRRSDPYVRFPPYGRRGLTLREIWDFVRQFDKATIAAFLQYFQPNRFISGFVLESKSEQAPNPESRVSLDHPRDAFGLNRVKLNWRTLPIDRRTVIRAEEILDREFRRLGIGTLASLAPSELEGWPANLEGGWHQIGTTRMHEDPKRGVVDRHGRVHGMANLFIAGSSIFPTGGAAPPTLTIAALALRLAAHLRVELGVDSLAAVTLPRRAAAADVAADRAERRSSCRAGASGSGRGAARYVEEAGCVAGHTPPRRRVAYRTRTVESTPSS